MNNAPETGYFRTRSDFVLCNLASRLSPQQPSGQGEEGEGDDIHRHDAGAAGGLERVGEGHAQREADHGEHGGADGDGFQ